MAHQTKDLFLLRRLRLLFLKILRCRIVRLLRLLRLPIATAYRMVENRAPKTANPTTCDRQYYTFEYMSFNTTSSNAATNSTNYECQSYNIANRTIKQLLLCCRSKQRKIDLVNCIEADAEKKARHCLSLLYRNM